MGEKSGLNAAAFFASCYSIFKKRGWLRFTHWIDNQGIWYLFLAPALILIIGFMIYPFIDGLQLAFYNWGGLGPRIYVGLENFTNLIKDKMFWQALRNTLQYAMFAGFGTVFLGLVFAVAISQRIMGWAVFRFIYYLPVMLPGVVVGALWARMYEYNFGIINFILRHIGLANLAVTWLGDERFALWAIIIVALWQFSGFPMIVLLAAIENIPQDLHDTATIDGVSLIQRIWYLIIPLIKPVIVSISVLSLIGSLKVFDLVFIMTKGGPFNSTQVLGSYLFSKAYDANKYGYASAIAVAIFLIIFTLTYVYQRAVKVEAHEF